MESLQPTSHFDLADFPLDSQMLRMTWISPEYGPEELEIVYDGGGAEEEFSETAWTIGEGKGYGSSYRVDMIMAEEEAKETITRFDYVIEVERSAIYYVWKVFVPICLIVFASWGVFWVEPTQLPVQSGISTAMLLTVIAFLFSLQYILPKINYLTRLDIFVYSSLVLIFLALVEALSTCTLAAHGNVALANRIDKGARIAFPAVFAAVLIWFWWV
jgi:hypothetical protein